MSSYENPILRGFYPDPSICRVGEDYYVVTSTFGYFPGVPIFHSRDLINWRQIGHCLTRASQVPLENISCSAGIFAPTIRHHEGIFYMVTTNIKGGDNFMVTATDPADEWSEPIWLAQEGIDPSLLFDEGKVYLTTSQNLQSEIDPATGEILGEPRKIWPGSGGGDLEAPHLYRIKDYYYLLCAEGGTHHCHMVTIGRSRNPWGPFESCPHNPILSNRSLPGGPIQAVGHGDLIEAHDGSWWMVCLGVRPCFKGFPSFHILGRETFLAPVQWTEDGWPVVNTTGHLTIAIDTPTLPLHPVAPLPVRDHFDHAKLAFSWIHLRNPQTDQYSLTARPGWLRLLGDAATLGDRSTPTSAFRRQTEYRCRVETLIDFSPTAPGQEAGLTVFMNEEHHYDLFVHQDADTRWVELRLTVGDMVVTRARAEAGCGALRLAITADESQYHFSFASGDDALQPLGTGRTRYLSTEVAKGFIGAMFGLYATSRTPAPPPADFDWFDYLTE